MWKKDEAMPDTPQEFDAAPRRPEAPRPTPTASSSSGGGAIIGPSITIRGEVSGDEDLLIQGKVDGSVELELHAVTVGGEGRVKANITGRVVTVEGEVEGDLKARDQVILRSAAKVKGDITAPRVVLEDGANFRGLVDMGDSDAAGSSASIRRSTQGSSAKSSSSSPSSSASASRGPNGDAGTEAKGTETGGKATTSSASRTGKDEGGASATQSQPGT